MQENKSQYCEWFVTYISGECSVEERISFEHHLPLCPSCQEEIKEAQQVWNALPWQMDIVEVPANLKAEVMGAIFRKNLHSEVMPLTADAAPITTKAAPIETSVAQITTNVMPITTSGISREKSTAQLRLSKAWSIGLAAAVAVLVIFGFASNYNLIQQQEAELKQALNQIEQQKAELNQALNQPADVEMLYSLNATLRGSKANGKACILKQGHNAKLVVYLYGLEATVGEEVYQVWLIEDGQRKNAGTFLVNDMGLGVLTYELKETEKSFDSIGVTLEPDSNGSAPRGKKVVGTET